MLAGDGSRHSRSLVRKSAKVLKVYEPTMMHAIDVSPSHVAECPHHNAHRKRAFPGAASMSKHDTHTTSECPRDCSRPCGAVLLTGGKHVD